MTYRVVVRMSKKATEMLEPEAAKRGYEAEAEKIIDEYTNGHATYKQALARLKQLINKH